MKHPCIHGSLLPLGLICDRGYLHIRLKTERGPFNRGCGPHTSSNEKIGRLALDDIRVKQRLGTFNLQVVTRIKFSEAMEIYWERHFIKYRDPRTHQPRSKSSLNTLSAIRALRSWFDEYYVDAIGLKELMRYRKKRLEYDGVANGTANREMATLGSFFNMWERWIAAEEVDEVKLPKKNPCMLLPDLEELPRDRVASLDELRALKQACIGLNDLPLWTVIETEIHTSLRKSDLMKLEAVEANADGSITLTQGKTGTNISLPASAKPNWSKIFTNFDSRWDRARRLALCPDLQFRDLRKTGLRLLETDFTPDQIASKAGHSDSKITKKWYLKGNQASTIAPMIEATKKILESL